MRTKFTEKKRISFSKVVDKVQKVMYNVEKGGASPRPTIEEMHMKKELKKTIAILPTSHCTAVHIVDVIHDGIEDYVEVYDSFNGEKQGRVSKCKIHYDEIGSTTFYRLGKLYYLDDFQRC